MTVSNENSKTSVMIMGGESSDYPFHFEALRLNPDPEGAKAGIKVKIKKPDGSSEILEYGRDYDVTLNIGNPGGTVHIRDNKDENHRLLIYREYPMRQESDYEDYNRFPANVLENNLDRLTFLIQQQKEKLDRSVIVDDFSGVKPAELIEEVERVYASIDNIDLNAENIGSINTNALNIEGIKTNADNIDAINTNTLNIGAITTNAGSIDNINTAALNIDAVRTNALNISDINLVASIEDEIRTTAGVAEEIADVAPIKDDITAVAAVNEAVINISDNIDAVSMNAEYIGAIKTNADNIDVIRTAETNALRAEAAARSIDPENLVHISGDETIAGVKTFKRGEGEEAERIKLIGDGETGVTSGGVNISGYDKNGAAIGRINFGTPSASLGKMIRFEVLNNAESAINYFALINNPDDTVEVAASGSVKSAITNWGFPGGTVTELTFPVSGTTLTFNDNGFVCIWGNATADGQHILLAWNGLETSSCGHNGNPLRVFQPVAKGGKVTIWHNIGTNKHLYFIKAKGG